MLKSSALKIYIQNRLLGKTEIVTLGVMLNSMKESEMFGKSDMLKTREMINHITDTSGSPEF